MGVPVHALGTPGRGRVADRVADAELRSGLRYKRALFLSVFASDDARADLNSFLHNSPGKAVVGGP
ncbi:hypothetical protein GCM10025762_50650 [Haloechinothrix salitolerans]